MLLFSCLNQVSQLRVGSNFSPREQQVPHTQLLQLLATKPDSFTRQPLETKPAQAKTDDPFHLRLAYKVMPSSSLKAGEWIPNVVPLHTVLMSLPSSTKDSDIKDEASEGCLSSLFQHNDMPDSMQAAYLKAMLEINPKLSVLCAVHDEFLNAKPGAKTFISKHYGIPPTQLYLIPTQEPVTKWAQDSAHPKLSEHGEQLEWWEPRGQYEQSHTLADGLAAAGLGKVPQETHFHGAGGDTEFVRDNKGELWVAFGSNTLLKTAQAYGLLPFYAKSFVGLSDKNSLELLGLALKTHAKDGVPLERQIVVGLHPQKRTIGDAFKSLSKEERQTLRRRLGAEVYRELHQRKMLELPQQTPKLHIDLMLRLMPEASESEAKSGLSAIVADSGWDKTQSLQESLQLNPEAIQSIGKAGTWLSSLIGEVVKEPERLNAEDSLEAYNRLAQQLQQQGIRVTRLPRKLLPEQRSYSSTPDLNYTNGQFVEHPETKQTLYLMPTEAKDLEHLTLMDKLAFNSLKQAFPQVKITPVGGETAVVHPQMGGGHCSFQVLPIKVGTANFKSGKIIESFCQSV